MVRVISTLLGGALLVLASAASAEPIKQLTHRDRLYDTTAFGSDLYAVGHPGLLLRSHDGGKTFESVRGGQTDEALFSWPSMRRASGP